MNAAKIVSIVIGLIFLSIGIALLMGFPVMWLWNWLMPVIFGLPVIGFWQAVGLMFLSSVMFKSNSTSSSK